MEDGGVFGVGLGWGGVSYILVGRFLCSQRFVLEVRLWLFVGEFIFYSLARKAVLQVKCLVVLVKISLVMVFLRSVSLYLLRSLTCVPR